MFFHSKINICLEKTSKINRFKIAYSLCGGDVNGCLIWLVV